MKLDEIDLKILRQLQLDGRLSNQDLAEKIALSPSACHRRLKALEQADYIDGYHALLNAEKLGFKIEAFVEINLALLSETEHNAFRKEISVLDEVINAYVITGQANYILHVRTRDFEDFSHFITNKLNRIKGIVKIHSQIVLNKMKSQSKFLPL